MQTAPAPQTVAPVPEWERISEAIHCPLCDYDLRGLIEPRCPECGFKFQWPDLLDPTLRRHPFIFEHHPERNLWSAWKTCTAMLRPKGFWTSLHPTQPSRPGRLFRYWLWPVLLTIGWTLAVSTAATIYANRRDAKLISVTRAKEIAFWKAVEAATDERDKKLAAEIIKDYGSIDAYLNQVYPAPQGGFEQMPLMLRYLAQSLPFAFIVWGWPWASILSLLIFSISMRKRRVRAAHVMRTVIYSQDLFVLIVAAWFALPILETLWPLQLNSVLLFGQPMGLLLFVVALGLFIYRMTIAYKYYLQFDHPFLTVLASQIVTGLALFVLLTLEVDLFN